MTNDPIDQWRRRYARPMLFDRSATRAGHMWFIGSLVIGHCRGGLGAGANGLDEDPATLPGDRDVRLPPVRGSLRTPGASRLSWHSPFLRRHPDLSLVSLRSPI